MKLEHIVVKAVCPSGSVSVGKGGRVRGLGTFFACTCHSTKFISNVLVGGLEFNASLAQQVVTPRQASEELFSLSCTFYPMLEEPIY